MKILYVIQTSDNYYQTRCESTINTWLKKINAESDYIFLSANPIGKKVVGYGTRDDYDSLPEKWFNFIKNYDFEKYDWVFVIDDDLFCFPDKLENYILENNLSKDEKIVSGNRNCYFSDGNDYIICGGGGILVSRKTIKEIKKFINSSKEPIRYLCGDCNFHYWFTELNVEIINSSVPNTVTHGKFINSYYKDNPAILSDLENCITLHYCKNEDKYELYNQFYK